LKLGRGRGINKAGVVEGSESPRARWCLLGQRIAVAVWAARSMGKSAMRGQERESKSNQPARRGCGVWEDEEDEEDRAACAASGREWQDAMLLHTRSPSLAPASLSAANTS
jgi:hypothetical protein